MAKTMYSKVSLPPKAVSSEEMSLKVIDIRLCTFLFLL